MQAWLASSLHRFYPQSPTETRSALTLDAARGERLSFQVACRTDDKNQIIEAQATAPDGLAAQTRRVGYVPMRHLSTQTPLDEIDGHAYLPGLVPDPLFSETTVHAGPYETNSFWITVNVPAALAPGAYPVSVTLASTGEDAVTLTATVNVHSVMLPQRRDFPVTQWLYADALCDWYGVQPFDDAFWRILDPYLANLATHGVDTTYVPMFTPSLDGVKRATQLLDVRQVDGRYQFDWSLVRRWVRAAQAQGITRFEWSHLFTQWGVERAIRIYAGSGGGEGLLWPPETGATSDTYHTFLSQFLPAFEQFLRAEGLFEHSFFHLSDEPHGEQHLSNYRAARAQLRELAPWMSVMDALSEIDFARTGLTDTPVPILTTAPQFIREGFPAWAYFCCGPRGRYLNRLLDTPLVKVRMSGWLLYKLEARGFLHWGYNYWYKRQTQTMIDPFTVNDAHAWPGWASGDPFVVYPGADGPIDSLRWEIFAESLQDYALLQASELTPTAPELAEIHDYAEFPRDAAWIMRQRQRLLNS